jgi:tRNA(fMet)-specific endonuclease VapC
MTRPSQVACVVDTDVVSYIFKCSPVAQLYLPHLRGKFMFISFMTVAELNRWALSKNWGAKSVGELEKYLAEFILRPFDKELCRLWAEVVVGGQRKGHVINVADAWIAATALINDIPLVTHNRRHFEAIAGLTVISES